ncbi:MAG: hypothetical protein OXC57_01690 [Rhodobacteraceae bacterium]|nr:hypothetical protein [Paracoccaceae bacterium]
MPNPLQSIIIETALGMEDLHGSDYIGADVAEAGTEVVELSRKAGADLFGSMIGKRDDRAPEVVHDGRSWYRVEPSKGCLDLPSREGRVLALAVPASRGKVFDLSGGWKPWAFARVDALSVRQIGGLDGCRMPFPQLP